MSPKGFWPNFLVEAVAEFNWFTKLTRKNEKLEQDKSLVLSNELINVELPPWKI